MVMIRGRNPRLPFAAAAVLQTVLPNNPAIAYYDLAGSWTTDATKARPIRPIVDGQGYEFCAPGATAAITITAAAPTTIIVNVQYTGLVTRDDPYNDVGSISINNLVVLDFRCPIPRVSDHPVSAKQIVVPVSAGISTVRVIWPYNASLDLVNFGLPEGVTLGPAPAVQAKKIAWFGDSRVHMMFVSKTTESFAYQTSAAKSAQILNLGYGGRQIEPGDATIAGSYGAEAAVCLVGFNTFYPNGADIAVVQNDYETIVTNYRAAATAVGKPASKLIMVSDLWSTSDAGGGGFYDGNSPTLQQFRDACAAAVTAIADPHCTYLAGNTGGMPTGVAKFPDGIHPNDSAADDIDLELRTVIGAI